MNDATDTKDNEMQSNEITVDVMPNGDLRYIAKPETERLSSIGETSKRRISRVEPTNFFKRIAFLFLRRVVRDDSRLAKWSRTWRCTWRVRMLDSGHIFGSFADRQSAIDAEVDYWNEIESLKG